MEVEKLDKNARSMLSYFNNHSDLSFSVLAQAFNEHYSSNLLEALDVLSFLQKNDLVKTKMGNEKAILIQVTHKGRIYEKVLAEHEKEKRRKLWSDRFWNVATLLLSALLTFIINIIMK